jgi:hypothetical protein
VGREVQVQMLLGLNVHVGLSLGLNIDGLNIKEPKDKITMIREPGQNRQEQQMRLNSQDRTI